MELTATEKSYIWLDSFELNEGEKRKLLSVAGSPVSLVREFEKFQPYLIDFGKENVYNNMRRSLCDEGKYFQNLLAFFKEKSIQPIAYSSNLYPKAWKEFSDAPLVLYAKGNLALLQKRRFGIVGSRRTQASALKVGERIAETLSYAFVIVTGSADGGDVSAIEGGLQGSGEVISLLASGFGSIPKANFSLLQKIPERGLILSPHAYDTPARNFSYEQRNKLLASLVEGVLVLGAGETSGALITAKYAKLQKKPVFALPYPPLSATGCGCNALIKDGGILTETAEDILNFYGLKAEKRVEIPLSADESKALQFLKEQGEAHLSEIASGTGIAVFKVTAILSSLEMKGVVVKLGGNRFSAV